MAPSKSKCQCCAHIGTSQLICMANQLTGFYVRAKMAVNGLNANKKIVEKYSWILVTTYVKQKVKLFLF